MIQPRTYPKYIGQALVLEPNPFVALVDDDNPWVEGLFLAVLIGALVGLAKFAGSWLLTATLPAPATVLEVLIHGIANSGILAQASDPVATEAATRQALTLLFTNRALAADGSSCWP